MILFARCARNCFMCPCCRNTLSVVSSDPPDADDGRTLAGNPGVVGEPPFFLYCSFCRWDSAEVDITFEKPTGLAGEPQTPPQTVHSVDAYWQHNCRDSRTLRLILSSSNVSKNTLSLSYVHPLPPASRAIRRQRTHTLPTSTPSQPQRRLRWHAISQV